MTRSGRDVFFCAIVAGMLGVVGAVAGLGELRAAEPLVATSWRFSTARPVEGWEQPEFDDATWDSGIGGFGEPSTPGSRVQTPWRTTDIWLRRRFSMSELPKRVGLLIHHDENAEVFLNGHPIAQLPGYTTQYQLVPLDNAARGHLRVGDNLFAIHCHQTTGGQYIDAFLVDVDDVPRLPPSVPFDSPLMTRWGRELKADQPWPEYPRPQLVRTAWKNLNGPWDYAVCSQEAGRPTMWDGQIVVPFCLESKLSGVSKLLEPTDALWYRRRFEWPESSQRRSLLHFEAVDYRCQVWLNDQLAGEHVGGSLPFSFDVSDMIRAGENEIVVKVLDATGGPQLRGKQTREPGGIWYTRVSGIWQTVWLEDVPSRYIRQLRIKTNLQGGIEIEADLAGDPLPGETLQAEVSSEGTTRAKGPLVLQIAEPRLWSPHDPYLYDLAVELRDSNGQLVDRVESYTGIRELGRVRDAAGHWRFTLNGQVIFPWGTLDQGWWPDGLLTPPSDAAMRSDLEFLKRAGFNLVRKHIKVEPRRYYLHCDQLGMLVWQDQVSGGEGPRWTRFAAHPEDATWSEADHRQYMDELDGMITTLDHFRSIMVWVPFNEAWGQHRTLDVGAWTVNRDPSRLVNVASGGNFWPVGQIADHHQYPYPGFPLDDRRLDDYIKVVGEFGGHGWPVRDHVWDASRRNWGYGDLPKSLDELRDRYQQSIQMLAELKQQGIAAGIYTQTSDVEGEVNGLLTYDREVAKIPAQELRRIHAVLTDD